MRFSGMRLSRERNVWRWRQTITGSEWNWKVRRGLANRPFGEKKAFKRRGAFSMKWK